MLLIGTRYAIRFVTDNRTRRQAGKTGRVRQPIIDRTIWSVTSYFEHTSVPSLCVLDAKRSLSVRYVRNSHLFIDAPFLRRRQCVYIAG